MKTKVNAKLGLAIGVLSGIAKEELVDADYVIESCECTRSIKNIHKIIKQKRLKCQWLFLYL